MLLREIDDYNFRCVMDTCHADTIRVLNNILRDPLKNATHKFFNVIFFSIEVFFFLGYKGGFHTC